MIDFIVSSIFGVLIGLDLFLRFSVTLFKNLSDDLTSKQGVGAIGRAIVNLL
jgi:hypothetical protein